MKNIRKRMVTGTLAVVMVLTVSITAFASTWKQDAKGWWWDNGNGTWPANAWQWCDGNGDGIAECYYFDGNGYCQLGGVTPDGFTVNKDGAWTVNGAVQSKILSNAGNVVTNNSAKITGTPITWKGIEENFRQTRNGKWKWDGTGWWWDNGDGTYLADTAAWCDGNKDGIAEFYMFDTSGHCRTNYTYPINGDRFNNDGALINPSTGQVATWKYDGSTSQQSNESNGGSDTNSDRTRQIEEKGFYLFKTSTDGKYLIYDTEHSSINVPKQYKDLFESLDIEYYTSNLDESEVSELVFDLVNMVREHDGVNALSHDEGLYEVAQARAVDVTEVQSHSKRPSGESAVSLYKEYGFTKGYGEINMYGSSNAAGIVAGWLTSPEHKKIMLKESYNYGEFGVADKNCYTFAYYYCVGSLVK